MPLFEITYDLRKPGQNYDALWDALRKAGARRALESVWMIRNGQTASQIRDVLKTLIDVNDRLLVTQVETWASYNTMIDINDV